MKNEFLLTFDWSASSLEDIRSWLPEFYKLSAARELVLIEFDIRTYGDLIAAFDGSRVPLTVQDSELVSSSLSSEASISKDSNPVSTTPIPTISGSLASISTRSTRSTRGKALKDDHVGNMVEIPEVLINPTSDSTIRVKWPVQVKKASEKVEGKEEVEFPHKVRVF